MKNGAISRLGPGRTSGGRRPAQSGMVSIMVTLIMMLVISLIVLGFSQVSRREQRQSLDRQLSTQAFFAAESAVNDARDAIAKSLARGEPVPEKDDCRPQGVYSASPVLDAANNVSYTCLLVTTKLTSLRSDLTAGGASTTLPFEVDPPAQLRTLRLKWISSTTPTATTLSNCPNATVRLLPATGAGAWTCPYGVVRLDIVPTATATLGRTAMQNAQKTIFLYPVTNAAPQVNYATADGAVAPMRCTVTSCDVDVTNMISGGSAFALRLSSQYVGGRAEISGLDVTGNPLELKNAQIQIDATGKAQDVLRRVQVRLAMDPAAAAPAYALQSGSSICKRFTVADNMFNTTRFGRGQDNRNPMCRTVSTNIPCAVPYDIVMALDSSNSMQRPWTGGDTRRERLRIISNQFVQRVGGGANNRIAITSFSEAIIDYQPFTSDVPTLTNFINNMAVLPGTKFVPPLTKAQAIFGTNARPGANKLMVFISDGEDYSNEAAVYALTDAMKASGTAVYTIGINPFNSRLAELENMASPGGYTSAVDVDDLEDVMEAISGSVSCN